MRTLVSGADGFIGRELIAYLVRSGTTEVHAVGRQAGQPNSATGAKNHSCDLTDNKTTTALIRAIQPTRIFHLAGNSRVDDSAPLEEYFPQNFLTTTSLLTATALLERPVDFFLASSAHVYGNQSNEVDERSQPSPSGFYGFSKYLAEEAARHFRARYPQLRIVVGRLYNCIGPGQPNGFVISDLAEKVRALPPNGGVLRTGPLDAVRSFVDVRDVVELLPKLFDVSPSGFEIYNLGVPAHQTIADVLNRLLKMAGKSARVESAPSAPNAFKGRHVKTERLQNALQPKFRPLDETLRDILAGR